MNFLVERKTDTIEVMLLPHKDGSGYSYINLTKGNICPCKFPTMEEAIADMDKRPEVVSYTELSSNPPLTLDELREMDGEPVWVEPVGVDFEPGWMLIWCKHDFVMARWLYCAFAQYEETWLAYRRKPEEGRNGL